MSKVLALDIGGKRTGIAETDPLKIIASPRETVATADLMPLLQSLIGSGNYECIVIGDPKNLDGGDSDNSALVRQISARIRKSFPAIRVELQDERFSSKRAMQSLVQSGVKKKKRREKGEIDKVSAAIILQDFLDSQSL